MFLFLCTKRNCIPQNYDRTRGTSTFGCYSQISYEWDKTHWHLMWCNCTRWEQSLFVNLFLLVDFGYLGPNNALSLQPNGINRLDLDWRKNYIHIAQPNFFSSVFSLNIYFSNNISSCRYNSWLLKTNLRNEWLKNIIFIYSLLNEVPTIWLEKPGSYTTELTKVSIFAPKHQFVQ